MPSERVLRHPPQQIARPEEAGSSLERVYNACPGLALFNSNGASETPPTQSKTQPESHAVGLSWLRIL